TSFLEITDRTFLANTALWDSYLQVVKVALQSCLVLGRPEQALEAVEGLPEIIRAGLPELVRLNFEARLAEFARAANEIQSLWLTALAGVTTAQSGQLTEAFEFVQLVKGLRTRYLRW